MKIKIEIPQIKCSRTTIEIGKDEIFYALMVFAGKLDNGSFVPSSKNPVFAKVSDVKEKVSKGSSWQPNPNDFELTIDDDITTLGITVALYEKDKGDMYKILQEQVSQIGTGSTFDWSSTIEETKDLILKDINNNNQIDYIDIEAALTNKPELSPKVVGTYLFQLAKRLGKFFSQDDLLGVTNDSIDIGETGVDTMRKYKFSKFRGIYELSLRYQKMKS